MPEETLKSLSCWIVTEGMAGTENQCLGVAQALGLQPIVKRITLKEPWKTFSPWLGLECAGTFSEDLSPPWPDLLLTSGRKAVAAARYIKKKSRGKTYTVHLQDPRVRPSNFDLVAVPYHDPTRGKNVIVTDTAPNRISDKGLEEARLNFLSLLNLPSPRIAVLIGGKSKAYDLPSVRLQHWIEDLKTLQRELGASLMITASRRTGAENMRRLQEAFPADAQTYFWSGEGDNPYMAFLATAKYIVVSADSVSMISDALSTGKPTYILPMDGGGRRIDVFHQHIFDKGYARPFAGILEHYAYTPLRESERIADEIRLHFHQKGGL